MLTAAESIPSIIPTGSKFDLTTDIDLCIRKVGSSIGAFINAMPTSLIGKPIASILQPVQGQIFPSQQLLSSPSRAEYFTFGILKPEAEPVTSLWKVSLLEANEAAPYFKWTCCLIDQSTSPNEEGRNGSISSLPLLASAQNGAHKHSDSNGTSTSVIDAVSQSTSIFFVIDEGALIKYSSPGIAEILGFCPKLAIGHSVYDYVDSGDIHKLKNLINSSGEAHASISALNIRLLNTKKDWIWVDVSIKMERSDEMILLFERLPDKAVSQPIVRQFSKTINDIVNSITDGFVAVDENMIVRIWNHVAEKVTGVAREDILGKHLVEEFPTIVSSDFYPHFKRAFDEKVTINEETYIIPLDLWFDLTVYPHENGLFIYFKDITVRKNQEMLLAVEKNVLEINARPNASLKDTIDTLLQEIHNIYVSTFCSVILYQEKDRSIHHLSGNWMSQQFIDSFDGKNCDLELGPFVRAISERKAVIDNAAGKSFEGSSEDMATRIHSCWSFPIVNGREEVLGCFSCYHSKSLEATEKHLRLFERMASFISIIIENRRAEENIRLSNDRYLLAARVSSQAIWDWDVKESVIFLGEGFSRIFEYDPSENIIPFDTWKQRIHHTDRDKVIKSLTDFTDRKDTGLWSCEYRFKKAGGEYSLVVNKGYITFNSNGDTIRMIGSIEDVTEKKNLEKKLIKEEIEKQRIIAQAIVDAQESERAKIGKELHDNVNQVLSTAKLFLEVAKTNGKDRISLIGKSAVQIHHAINEIRHISQSLVPPSISDIGLSESIKDLVQNIAVSKTLKVEYNNIGDIEKNITDNQKVMIFRVIQEQVNNVLKHAEATRISIQLRVDNKEIELVIADNGKGFDQEKTRMKKGVGLTNIASRVDLFNGKVDIISAPGEGCQLVVKILRNLKQ